MSMQTGVQNSFRQLGWDRLFPEQSYLLEWHGPYYTGSEWNISVGLIQQSHETYTLYQWNSITS